MGRKVFVSYKFSDAVETRDKIIRVLQKDGTYYKGEKGYKELKYADSTLKGYLADMIYDSTVTIVVISPEVIYSEWVEWEIKYSLERQTRAGRTSKRNGVVCVIQANTDYSSYNHLGEFNKNSRWAYNIFSNNKYLKSHVFPNIIKRNMKNSFNSYGQSVRNISFFDEENIENKDYCIVVAESTFMKNPNKYIEEAFQRANDSSYETETR